MRSADIARRQRQALCNPHRCLGLAAGHIVSCGRRFPARARRAPSPARGIDRSGRQAADRGLRAAHADAGDAACGIAPAVECASCLAAWLADGAIVLRPAAAAGRTKARLQPFPPPPPVAGAAEAAALLRIAAAVKLALLSGFGAAGTVGCAALLGAVAADLEAGLGRKATGAGAHRAWPTGLFHRGSIATRRCAAR